jgi:hypothetical protein
MRDGFPRGVRSPRIITVRFGRTARDCIAFLDDRKGLWWVPVHKMDLGCVAWCIFSRVVWHGARAPCPKQGAGAVRGEARALRGPNW